MNMIRRIFSYTAIGIAVAVVLVILVFNVRLYYPPPTTAEQNSEDVIAQLRFIRHSIDEGAGQEMQQLFPEGDFFTHVLYGLSWVNIGLQFPDDAPEREQAIAEARWAWNALGSADAVAPYRVSQSLAPEYGIFYVGWRNYLLAGLLQLETPTQRDPSELATFQQQCEEIAEAVQANPTPFLQAYPGSSWPVDMFPAMVSLRVHTQLIDDRFEPVVDAWLATVPSYLDPDTNLLPHRVDYRTGRPVQGTRATSQILILQFLYDLDPEMGREHYQRFRENHVVYLWGFPGVREYRKGVEGVGDVDSGPLIQGITLSATAIALGTSRIYGDSEVHHALWHAGEMLGLPTQFNGMKRYWFGILPVGDAFLVWAKTAVSWTNDIASSPFTPLFPTGWRIRITSVSLLICALLVWFAKLLWPRPRQNNRMQH